jgi:Rieske Fe-S protein
VAGSPSSGAPTSPAAGTEPSRRRFLDVLLASSAFAWLAAVVYPVIRYLTPPKEGGGTGRATLTEDQKKDLQVKKFLILPIGSERVLLVKDKDSRLRALSAKCTHEGCTVQYQPSDEVIWCACHNGKFTLDGRVLSGPPPRSLAPFAVEGDLSGPVTVSKTGVGA